MEEYELFRDYTRDARDSNGTQEKYFYDNKWFKVDTLGCESDAEVIVSRLLDCAKEEIYHVHYEPCKVNGHPSCVSENFLREGEQYLTFEKLYFTKLHSHLKNDISTFRDVADRREYLINTMNEITGIDLSKYIDYTLLLDALILNPDRHFLNMGVIATPTGFREAPIFDNGQALGCNWSLTPSYFYIQECVDYITTATIAGSPWVQALVTENRFKLYIGKVKEAVHEYENKSRAYRLLMHQLSLYKDIFYLGVRDEQT